MEYNNDNVRRRDRLLSEDEATTLLRDADHGVLSMCGTDGEPYGIPLNYVWDGADCIYFHCAPEGRKLRILAENKNVSFCVVGKAEVQPERFTAAYQSIVLKGTACVVSNDEERWKAIRLILEKLSPAYIDQGMRLSEKSFGRVAIVRMNILTISGKAKRKQH